MVSVFVMQAMAIHPADGIYIEPEDAVYNSNDFYEPFFVVERAVHDTQMEHIGQIQPAKKPTKDKINSAYQYSSPRSQMSWGEIHTSQDVEKNNQITRDIICFHDDSRRVIQT